MILNTFKYFIQRSIKFLFTCTLLSVPSILSKLFENLSIFNRRLWMIVCQRHKVALNLWALLKNLTDLSVALFLAHFLVSQLE